MICPRRLLAALVIVGGTLGLSATSGQASAHDNGSCLWAGGAYAYDTTVVAGGWTFTCGTERSAPHWFRGRAVTQRSTVPNPGARPSPIGRFSPGAQQPGTTYNDYCSGSQLIEGAESVYEVVSDGRTMWWKAAASISRWTFGPDDFRPGPSWRSSSLCFDGSLS